jgi:hypothetical protein
MLNDLSLSTPNAPHIIHVSLFQVSKVKEKDAKHSQLNRVILLCDDIPDVKTE